MCFFEKEPNLTGNRILFLVGGAVGKNVIYLKIPFASMYSALSGNCSVSYLSLVYGRSLCMYMYIYIYIYIYTDMRYVYMAIMSMYWDLKVVLLFIFLLVLQILFLWPIFLHIGYGNNECPIKRPLHVQAICANLFAQIAWRLLQTVQACGASLQAAQATVWIFLTPSWNTLLLNYFFLYYIFLFDV